MGKITNFLLFNGRAEEAMLFYTTLFSDSEIISSVFYLEAEQGPSGKIKQGRFLIKGQEFRCMDNASEPFYAFTPALSFLVSCEREEEMDTYFAGLSKDGKIYMPPGPYPFCKKFAWVEDKFGISWQLHWGEITFRE